MPPDRNGIGSLPFRTASRSILTTGSTQTAARSRAESHCIKPEVLQFIEMEVPAPDPHKVRIKVKVIGINRVESMWRNDKYVESQYSRLVWAMIAPVLSMLSARCHRFLPWATRSVRSRPCPSTSTSPTGRSFSRHHAVVKHPESLSFVEAASVWMMFITAYGALVFDAQVKSGDVVIIPAASSSVGLAAIRIASYAGATPIALTRTSDKKKRLQAAGAAHAVATRSKTWSLR